MLGLQGARDADLRRDARVSSPSADPSRVATLIHDRCLWTAVAGRAILAVDGRL
jgi:hypothetical protein